MTKTKLVLLASFLVTFAAGAALGLVLAGPARHQPHSWLTAELNLTSDQREQMRKIWADVGGPGARQHGERRSAIAQQRDQAIAALFTDAQKTQYQAIQQEYTRKMDELSQERKKAFAEAIERTKKILTPEQAAKYDELMKKQRDRGPGGPPGFHGPRDRRNLPDTNTRPAAGMSTPRSGE